MSKNTSPNLLNLIAIKLENKYDSQSEGKLTFYRTNESVHCIFHNIVSSQSLPKKLKKISLKDGLLPSKKIVLYTSMKVL